MANLPIIIIGASAAGLACAACLKKEGIPFILLEQESRVAHAWRNHYDRLHLNTVKKYSALPYLPFPDDAPLYVSRDQVVSYLEAYAKTFEISPLFNHRVIAVRKEANSWIVETDRSSFATGNIIIATGFNRRPFMPYWEGIDKYQGAVLHSSEYKNGERFRGQQVLVVGFGNSACEIGICLHEYNAFPSMSVQGPVNIVSRGTGQSKVENFLDSFAWVSKLAPAFIDSINASSLRAKYGEMENYGLQKLPYGPNVQIVKYNRVPLLDIGTFDLIKKGIIKIYPRISRFTERSVCFTDGREQHFDAVVLGTGYRSAISDFLPNDMGLFDPEGRPFSSGLESVMSGLFFCGFKSSPLGMLREIGLEATRIARLLKRRYTA